MPFIISAGTVVTGFGAGIQSINFTLNPQIQRLYQLGTPVPYDKNLITQASLSITRYAPGTPQNVEASIDCVEPDPLVLSIFASNCAGGVVDLTDEFFITSYSYQKEIQGWGLETYSLINRPTVIGGGDGVETRMIRGVAEGQTTTDGGADTGVVFLPSPTVNGQTVEVTAGSPGIGRANSMEFGEVQVVGGGTSKSDGRDGNASVSIPYTPIYIPL